MDTLKHTPSPDSSLVDFVEMIGQNRGEQAQEAMRAALIALANHPQRDALIIGIMLSLHSERAFSEAERLEKNTPTLVQRAKTNNDFQTALVHHITSLTTHRQLAQSIDNQRDLWSAQHNPSLIEDAAKLMIGLYDGYGQNDGTIPLEELYIDFQGLVATLGEYTLTVENTPPEESQLHDIIMDVQPDFGPETEIFTSLTELLATHWAELAHQQPFRLALMHRALEQNYAAHERDAEIALEFPEVTQKAQTRFIAATHRRAAQQQTILENIHNDRAYDLADEQATPWITRLIDDYTNFLQSHNGDNLEGNTLAAKTYISILLSKIMRARTHYTESAIRSLSDSFAAYSLRASTASYD